MVSRCLGITTGCESTLWWVAEGMANSEIENILGPSAVTVPKHKTDKALTPFELVRRSLELALNAIRFTLLARSGSPSCFDYPLAPFICTAPAPTVRARSSFPFLRISSPLAMPS